MVTYELQETGYETVGIGPNHVVFPVVPARPAPTMTPASRNQKLWMHLHPIRETGPFDGVIMLRNVRSGYYLHVIGGVGKYMHVTHSHSMSDGSKWQVDLVNDLQSCVFLKNVRSGNELHVRSQEASPGGRVAHWSSRTAGSQWQVQHVGSSGSNLVALKSVRSGCYLTVPDTTDDGELAVLHSYARSDFFHPGNVWEFEQEVEIPSA